MSKHTPGPFVHSPNLRIGGAHPESDGIDIGSVHGANIGLVYPAEGGDRETWANAYLWTHIAKTVASALNSLPPTPGEK